MELTNLNESVNLPEVSIRSGRRSDRLVASGSAFDLYAMTYEVDGACFVMMKPGKDPRRDRHDELLRITVNPQGRYADPTGYGFRVQDTRYFDVKKTVTGRMDRSGDEDDARADGVLNRLASETLGKLDPDDRDGSWEFLNRRLVPIAKRIIPDAKYDKHRIRGNGRLLVHGKNW